MYPVLFSILSFCLGCSFMWLSRTVLKGEKHRQGLEENEKMYRNLAEKYEGMVNNIREVIFQLDYEGKFIYLNPSWKKLTGYSCSESIGAKIQEFVFRSEVTEDLANFIPQKIENKEFYIITKDLKTKMVEISMIPVLSRDKKRFGYSGTIYDITERKQQELLLKSSQEYVGSLNENLEKQIREEVKKNREKDLVLIQQSKMASIGELLTSMGHQWVQAINSLSLLIQDVREALEFGEVNDDYIDTFISESMAHINLLTRTMNDYRDLYMPAKDKVFFSVGDSIEDALSIFSSSLIKHNIHVEFEYGGKQTAYGFPNEYSQVVLNILTYIRDVFLQRDTQKRAVTIKIAECEKELTTELFGNTGGIEQETLEKIFDPYYSTSVGGSGLGLYMAKMIVENMNGHFKVENSENGAKFSLILIKKTKEKHSDPLPAL